MSKPNITASRRRRCRGEGDLAAAEVPKHRGAAGRILNTLQTQAEPLLILLLGVFLSILYFGHQVVPNSDFTAFVETGRSILSFDLPSSFKRLPGLGILQILLSVFVGGMDHILTAGLLLNAILYPLCGVLLYGIARRFVGEGAFWVSLIALLNPWVMEWLVHPIVEVPLSFSILLTFYVLFRWGRWAYLPAFLASMLRYEGAALIGIVFLWDFFGSSSWRGRGLAFVRAFVTGLPLMLWVWGMFATRQEGAFDYIGGYEGALQKGVTVYGQFAGYLWQMSISALAIATNEGLQGRILVISRIAMVVALAGGLVWAIVRKRWDVLSLWLFAGLFFLLHASRSLTRPRYAVPGIWPVFMLFCWGLWSLWSMIHLKWKPPAVVGQLAAAVAGIAFLFWALGLAEPIAKLVNQSRPSVYVPFAALTAALMAAALRLRTARFRGIGVVILALGFSSLAAASNQFSLIRAMGPGTLDKTFRDLAVWYVKNARPDEKLVTTLPHVVRLFVPEARRNGVVAMQNIPGETLEEFVENCIKRGVVYIAWDSRIGLSPQNAYYKRWKMERVAPLIRPANLGPLKFVTQIRNEDYPNRWINLFLLPRPSQPVGEPDTP